MVTFLSWHIVFICKYLTKIVLQFSNLSPRSSLLKLKLLEYFWCFVPDILLIFSQNRHCCYCFNFWDPGAGRSSQLPETAGRVSSGKAGRKVRPIRRRATLDTLSDRYNMGKRTEWNVVPVSSSWSYKSGSGCFLPRCCSIWNFNPLYSWFRISLLSWK